LNGIELGHFWAGKYNNEINKRFRHRSSTQEFLFILTCLGVNALNHLFGNTDTALALKEFMLLVQREMTSQGFNDLSSFQIMMALSSWVSLQERTAKSWEFYEILEDPLLVILTDNEKAMLIRQMRFACAAYGLNYGNLYFNLVRLLDGNLPVPSLSRFTGIETPQAENVFTVFTMIENDDILYESVVDEGDGSKHEPTFHIIQDHKMKQIVVTIRGTYSVHDLMVDLVCESHEIEYNGKKYHVHEGMYKAAKFIASSHNTIDVIRRALLEHEDYGLVINGHSLGAGIMCLSVGIAAILYLLICKDGKTNSDITLGNGVGLVIPDGRQCKVFCYGCLMFVEFRSSCFFRGSLQIDTR
jgi:hypothetical protein